jgi:hypothetical protein
MKINSDLLTGDQVIGLIESFPGLNPAVGEAVISEYRKNGRFVHAVLKSLNLEPVTMWRQREDAR